MGRNNIAWQVHAIFFQLDYLLDTLMMKPFKAASSSCHAAVYLSVTLWLPFFSLIPILTNSMSNLLKILLITLLQLRSVKFPKHQLTDYDILLVCLFVYFGMPVFKIMFQSFAAITLRPVFPCTVNCVSPGTVGRRIQQLFSLRDKILCFEKLNGNLHDI